MNKGVEFSSGRWLFFLGADDVLFDSIVFETIFSKSIPAKFSLIAGDICYESTKSQFIYSKKRKIKTSSWSSSIWLRNSLHHQGTFYRKQLFKHQQYKLKYKILADYDFNLMLYKARENCQIINLIVSKCAGNGLSKTGDFSIYKEEICLKTNQSSKLFLPFFFIIAFLKYVLGKANSN